ncbi:MAG: hypothetical protein R2784_12060 [Saprospiraceae bacterium]
MSTITTPAQALVLYISFSVMSSNLKSPLFKKSLFLPMLLVICDIPLQSIIIDIAYRNSATIVEISVGKY